MVFLLGWIHLIKMKSLTKMTSKYIGKSFDDCGCLQLIHNWYHTLGFNFPDKYKDLELNTYMLNWQEDKKGTITKMIELFKTLGEEVDVHKIQRHDLLAVEEKGNIYAAIAIASNTAITSHLIVGPKIFKLGKLHKVIIARRLI